MKYFVFFIVGGIASLIFSFIAENYSRLTALITLAILTIISITISFVKKSKYK